MRGFSSILSDGLFTLYVYVSILLDPRRYVM